MAAPFTWPAPVVTLNCTGAPATGVRPLATPTRSGSPSATSVAGLATSGSASWPSPPSVNSDSRPVSGGNSSRQSGEHGPDPAVQLGDREPREVVPVAEGRELGGRAAGRGPDDVVERGPGRDRPPVAGAERARGRPVHLDPELERDPAVVRARDLDRERAVRVPAPDARDSWERRSGRRCRWPSPDRSRGGRRPRRPGGRACPACRVSSRDSSISSTQSPGANPSAPSRPGLDTVSSSPLRAIQRVTTEPFSRDQTNVAVPTAPPRWISTR